MKNLYSEACRISSGPAEKEHSLRLLNDLLQKNGYQNPRRYFNSSNSNRRQSVEDDSRTVLNLDFISDSASNKIRNYVKQNNLPIKVNFKPTPKLRNILCSNRPYDKRVCSINSCKICPLIVCNKDCEVKNVVY